MGDEEQARASSQILPLVFGRIRVNVKQKEIHIDILNGHSDHLHCLFGLNVVMSVSKSDAADEG